MTSNFIIAITPALFLIAIILLLNNAIQKKRIPASVAQHPAVFIFTLSTLISSWFLLGSTGFAYQYGYSYFAHYYGVSALFIIAPIFLLPLYRLTHTYQLLSLADLFVFRYRSSQVGRLVALISLIASIPLLSSQITTANQVFYLINPSEKSSNIFAVSFSITLFLLTIHLSFSGSTKHENGLSLVLCTALAGFIKMGCIVIIAVYAYFFVLDETQTLYDWLSQTPQATEMLYSPLEHGNWSTLIFVSFASAITLPHIYHSVFSAYTEQKSIIQASWGLPLLILITAIIPPFILWSTLKLKIFADPNYALVHFAIASHSKILILIVSMASLIASGAIIIAASTNLSVMLTNYLVLPYIIHKPKSDLISTLPKFNALFVMLIILLCLFFHLFLNNTLDLTESLFLTLALFTQFSPGLVGVLFWTSATRMGFICGLICGFIIWLLGLFLPTLDQGARLPFDLGFSPNIDNWQAPTMTAFIVNMLVFIGVSIYRKPSPQERYAAEACVSAHVKKSIRSVLAVNSIAGFIRKLSHSIGHESAEQEVKKALQELGLTHEEVRPYNLRRLKDRIEINLSYLLGPMLAGNIIETSLDSAQKTTKNTSEDIYFIESHLERYQFKLTGLARALDQLRRFHRNVLQDLPIGVCIIGSDNELIAWNKTMEKITHLMGEEVIGASLSDINAPWNALISQFITAEAQHVQYPIEIDKKQLWLGFHKTQVSQEKNSKEASYLVILVEDYTEIKVLQSQLAHSDRLASVGRLAVGIAHEIGNPVTGIACLAQEIIELSRESQTHLSAQQILSLTKRISNIVQSLINYSHAGKTEYDFRTVNLREIISEALSIIQLNPKSKQIQFILDQPDITTIHGDSQKLIQVFINLFDNALDAITDKEEGIIIISVRADPQYISVTVKDNGVGISQEILPHIFEPFVTTKEPGKGTGLGLSLIYNIIRDHGGTISIVSPIKEEKTGTEATIHLPKCYLSEEVLP